MSGADQALGTQRVVIDPTQCRDGSAMQRADGAVRDLKLIYSETGFDALSLYPELRRVLASATSTCCTPLTM